MKKEKTNRTELLQVRLMPEELKTIKNRCSKSTCRKLSDYARKMLLSKPIIIKHRNQSLDDFMTEMITLRSELNAIGNNFNQLLKRLHSLQHFDEIKAWLLINETARQILLKKVTEIKAKINQINDQWLQS